MEKPCYCFSLHLGLIQRETDSFYPNAICCCLSCEDDDDSSHRGICLFDLRTTFSPWIILPNPLTFWFILHTQLLQPSRAPHESSWLPWAKLFEPVKKLTWTGPDAYGRQQHQVTLSPYRKVSFRENPRLKSAIENILWAVYYKDQPCRFSDRSNIWTRCSCKACGRRTWWGRVNLYLGRSYPHL